MANKDGICECCGHLESSHSIGTGRCKVDFCECREFAFVLTDEPEDKNGN